MQKQMRISLDGLVPFTTVRVVSLMFVGLTYLGFHKLAFSIFHRPLLGWLCLVVISASVEISLNINAGGTPITGWVYRFLLSTKFWIHQQIFRVRQFTYKNITAILSYVAVAIMLTALTTHFRHGGTPVNSDSLKETLKLSATLISVLMVAAAFAGNRMAEFAPKFISLVVFNRAYKAFLGIIVAGALVDVLGIFTGGVDQYLNLVSVTGAVYGLVSLPLVLIETMRTLDAAHVITKFEQETNRILKRVPKQVPILSALEEVKPTLSWGMVIQKHLTGKIDLAGFLPKLTVPEEIVGELEEKVQSITSIALRATILGRREDVLSCLGCLAQITDRYTLARQTYEGQGVDSFLMFVEQQLEIIFRELSKKPTDENYASDMVLCVQRMAHSALRLSLSIKGAYPTNGQMLMFNRFLQRIAAQSFKLQYSSASPDAARAIGSIGEQLVRQEAYETVQFGSVAILHEIGRAYAQVQVPPSETSWLAVNTQTVLAQLTKLLTACLQQEQVTGHYYDRVPEEIIEAITDILQTWYKRKQIPWESHTTNQVVIAPIVGSLWGDAPTWAVTAAQIMRNSQNHRSLGTITKMVAALGGLANLSVRSKASPQYEYFDALAKIGYESVLLSSKQAKSKEVAALLDTVYRAILAAIREVYESDQNSRGFDELVKLSPIWAFTLWLYTETKSPELLTQYVQGVEGLMQLIRDLEERDMPADEKPHETSRDAAEVYSYLKMFCEWLSRFVPTEPFNEQTMLFLADHFYLDLRNRDHRGSIGSYNDMDRLGYPSGDLREIWHIQPNEHWGEQWDMTRTLNNLDAYRKYHRNIRVKVAPEILKMDSQTYL